MPSELLGPDALDAMSAQIIYTMMSFVKKIAVILNSQVLSGGAVDGAGSEVFLEDAVKIRTRKRRWVVKLPAGCRVS